MKEHTDGIYRDYIMKHGTKAMPRMVYDDRRSATLMPKGIE